MSDKEKDNDLQGAYNPALTEEAFEKSGRRAWKDSPQGRAAIRLFSRGIMGAAFFTAGGLLTRRWMHHENPAERYNAENSLLSQENPLKFIAKLIDIVVARPIEFVVKTVTGNKTLALEATRFRPTKFKGDFAKTGVRGRSLGNETVFVTFDFFCASIGDALGRDIADFFDSKVEKKWLKDGHIDFKQAAKSAAKSTWRYVSYNGGEDWAVAIPYVYFMKGQRAVINKFSPGFMYDFDRNLNGGSHKVDDHGNIIGNYAVEGIVDLQSRFTVYNMGTLMYRELYDYTARKMQGKNAVLYGAPDRDTSHESIGEKIANVGKWMLRSVTKGAIYMTPATTMFWITRTPQTKYRGLMIHPEKGMLCYPNEAKFSKAAAAAIIGKPCDAQHEIGKHEAFYSNEPISAESRFDASGQRRLGANGLPTGTIYKDTPMYFAHYDPHHAQAKEMFVHSPNYSDAAEINEFVRAKVAGQPIDSHTKTHGMIDAGLNRIGKFNNKAVLGVRGFAERKEEALAKSDPSMLRRIKKLLMLHPDGETFTFAGKKVSTIPEKLSRFTDPFVNASFSYTPYMYAKAEAAKLWDTGKMDLALERMIDGASSLNWREFKSGVGETTNAILHRTFKDPEREKEGQRRILIDTSDAAAVNRTANGNGDGVPERKPELDWRERMVSGKKPEIAAHANAPKNHREREEMRKALEELQPPTNSIN